MPARLRLQPRHFRSTSMRSETRVTSIPTTRPGSTELPCAKVSSVATGQCTHRVEKLLRLTLAAMRLLTFCPLTAVS